MIVDTLIQAVRWLGAVLCNWIYELIAMFYQLFMTVSRLNILSSDEIGPIYQRVTMILTIVMVFYITFEFVKYVIQPDTMTDKDKGATNIVKRMIIVVVLIALVPTIFSYAYKIQNKIIENQVFSKIILGKTNSDFSTFGNSFSSNMLSIFYGVDSEVCTKNNCSQAENIVASNLNTLASTGQSRIQKGINETVRADIDGETENVPMIKFDGLMAIIVGGFIVYILVMYSIDVGTRYAQLIFLQIMSPVAIISYISPKKDGMFSKWTKQCITTYLDLFIRLAIIYFVLLIIEVLGNSFTTESLFAGLDVTPAIKAFSYIALVMGLLVFAQKAPKMLSELLPGGGSASIGYGLGAKGRIEPTKKAITGTYKGVTGTVGMARRTAGAVGGAIAGAAAQKGFAGRFRGAVAGAKTGSDKKTKGLLEGSLYRRIQKSYAAGGKTLQEDEDILANAPSKKTDGTEASRGYRLNQARMHSESWANKAKEQDRQLNLYDIPKKGMDAITAQIDEFKQIKTLKQEIESAKSRGASAAEVKTLDAKYKSACQTIRREIVKNKGDFKKVKAEADSGNIKFNWDQLDENGFKIPGTKQQESLKLDEGDNAFATPLYTISQNEIEKLKELQRHKDLGEIEVDIDGKMKKIKELDLENNPEEYIQYIHKFKDAMVGPKVEFENSTEYVAAHTYSKGAGGSGKGGN